MTEVAVVAGEADIDIAELMLQDIKTGNTATLRSAYKFSERHDDFRTTAIDGMYGVGIVHGEIQGTTFMGGCPVKDDYSAHVSSSDGGGYLSLPNTDARKKEVIRFFKAHDLKLEDLDEAVVNPKDIPPILDANGNPNHDFKRYKDAYESDKELKKEHPTLEAYRTSLVEDLEDQRKQIDDISDIYVTMGVLGSTFSEENAAAVYFTMANIFPKVTYNGKKEKKKNQPPLDYVYEVVFGRGQFAKTTATCGWESWSHIIRRGRVINEFDGAKPRMRRHKSNWKIRLGSDKVKASDGDPIVSVLQANIREGESSDGMLQIQVQLTDDTYGEIRVWGYGTLHGFTDNRDSWRGVYASLIDESSGDGSNNFLSSKNTEVKTVSVNDGSVDVFSFPYIDDVSSTWYQIEEGGDGPLFTMSRHGVLSAKSPLDYAVKKTYYVKARMIGDISGSITLDSDGRWVNLYQQTVDIDDVILTINVLNTNNESEPPDTGDNPFEDELEDADNKGSENVFFPLEYKAMKEIPLFRRERLMRECLVVGVYSNKRIKLKWYQTKAFRWAVFIVGLLLSPFTGGQSLTLVQYITQVVQLLIQYILVQVVMKFLSGIINAPLLLAIAQFIYKLYNLDFSSINFKNLADAALSGMKAASTYEGSIIQKKMLELQEEMESFKEKAKKATVEMEKLMEESGTMITEDAIGAIKAMANLAKIENADRSFSRTLDLSTALSTDPLGMLDLDSQLITD
jgi:hypothetical protein